MSKKKMKKKAARRKARPVDAAEAKLQVEVAEVRASVDDEAAPVCAFAGCYAEVPGYGDHCVKHMPSEPHVVSDPSAAEEIAASDNIVIREAVAKPKSAPYVPPPPCERPVLPKLANHPDLEFHTPPGRRGMYCDVAFAMLLDDADCVGSVIVRRVQDRLASQTSYMLAGIGDLDTIQDTEIASHYWHEVTDEEHASIAAYDPDPAEPMPIDRKSVV